MPGNLLLWLHDRCLPRSSVNSGADYNYTAIDNRRLSKVTLSSSVTQT